MVTEQTHEVVTSGLKQQIRFLSDVIEEMEQEHLGEESLSWRLRTVEMNLRRLRAAA